MIIKAAIILYIAFKDELMYYKVNFNLAYRSFFNSDNFTKRLLLAVSITVLIFSLYEFIYPNVSGVIQNFVYVTCIVLYVLFQGSTIKYVQSENLTGNSLPAWNQGYLSMLLYGTLLTIIDILCLIVFALAIYTVTSSGFLLLLGIIFSLCISTCIVVVLVENPLIDSSTYVKLVKSIVSIRCIGSCFVVSITSLLYLGIAISFIELTYIAPFSPPIIYFYRSFLSITMKDVLSELN